MSQENKDNIQSFEVTAGGVSGDLISARRQERRLKVGLLAGGYFEYWRMYEGLRDDVERDMQHIADRLSEYCELIYPGMVDTLDKSDAAGVLFKEENVDMIIIAQGTYMVDYLIHQGLLHIQESTPLLLFASQKHQTLDDSGGYKASLQNSGPMGVIQFACGLHKMKKFMNYEVVVGAIDDPQVYKDIAMHIKIREIIMNLRFWNIGIIGHILRGMYDFQYDKTDVTGKLGPHIMDIEIKHLSRILDEISLDDERVTEIVQKAKNEYQISGLTDIDLQRGARLGVAFKELIKQYKLDGLALLGQHFIEVQAQTTCYLGLAEVLSNDLAMAVTEGDVLGLIVSKVMKDLTGINPFFGEWEEIYVELNAVLLLGHGFIDPRTARKDRPVKLQRACEEWGFEGNAPGFQATLPPGPVTVAHIINHGSDWKLLVSEGTIPDLPPIEISESTVVVEVSKPVREYFREILLRGFSHHAIAVPGAIGCQLEAFARQLDIEVHWI